MLHVTSLEQILLLKVFFLISEAEKSVLCRYAKNFIPIFCQICSAKTEKNLKDGDDAFRLSVLETLKCYLKISPEQA